MDSLIFLKYSNIFIDCDGVVIDSNRIKEDNISKVLKKYLSKDLFNDCLSYFNSNPGMPREKKLSKFIFSENLLNCILDEYNKLNLESLKNSRLVDGVIDFLKVMRTENKKIILVSGGLKEELVEIFSYKQLLSYFDVILGGPHTKEENIRSIIYHGESIFFGDSKIDLETANLFKMDFIFVSGYTNYDFSNTKQELNFKTIRNFNDINLKHHD
jgi:phosphoglycolate phosphatase-like HAD superfamily hydrolase